MFYGKKSRLRRGIQWRKQRKIIIQSLSVSSLYLVFNFPWTIIQLCHYFNLLMDAGINSMAYQVYFSYYIIFLFPFVSCGTIPELGKTEKTYRLSTNTTSCWSCTTNY